jgi:HD-GYP domain-containing protein (c-di-GMP phosphodiesterase class II)
VRVCIAAPPRDNRIERWKIPSGEDSLSGRAHGRGATAGESRSKAKPGEVTLTELRNTRGIAASYAPLVHQRLCVHAAGMLGVEHAAVFVREIRRPDRMIAVAATETELIGGRCDAGREPAGLAMCSGRPLYVPNYRVLERPLTLPGTGATRLAAAPVAFSNAVRGALAVWIPDEAGEFELPNLGLLGELGALVGRFLGHRRRWHEPAAELDALAGELAEVDAQTARHVEHVVSLALGLGSVLGLSRVELFELELGARFHDIGKLRVPPRILHKPGKLSAGEWDLMRLHSMWGADMLAGIAGLEAVSLIVRAHHERFDGSGYPDGLAGDRIPLAARIVSVCDAYSAMTSDRPYSPPLSTIRALSELEQGAGSQFDPAVARALARVIRRGARLSRSLADHLDHEPLRAAPVELGVEDLLPRA